jgi:hypothetical protein
MKKTPLQENSSSGLHIRYENIVSFWTKKEYELQELIINGIVVHREIPGKTLKTIPFARIDIFYDSPNGIGRKAMNGVEHKVYQEAKKFLSAGELDLLNDNWIRAKYDGKYNWNDPFCRKPIYDKTLPSWITGKSVVDATKNLTKKIKDQAAKAVKESEASLDKRINEFVKHLDLPKEKIKESPLQDLFLTKDIDPKDVADKNSLSTLYKHIKGDRELSKGKAIEYARTLGVAPASLMFEPQTITVWSNVRFSSNVKNSQGKILSNQGECYQRSKMEVTLCPSDIYRLDIKAIRVNDPESIYDGFMAYYYETNTISDTANNKLCMIRTKNKSKTLLGGYYRYFLGIYQIFGTKKIILNPDPLAQNKIIADNITPDIVAPIISFTNPIAMFADKVLSKNLKQVQQLGELIRKEREDATAKIRDQIKELETKIEAQNKQILKTKLFGYQGLLANDNDDIIVPEFLKREEKKRA